MRLVGETSDKARGDFCGTLSAVPALKGGVGLSISVLDAHLVPYIPHQHQTCHPWKLAFFPMRRDAKYKPIGRFKSSLTGGRSRQLHSLQCNRPAFASCTQPQSQMYLLVGPVSFSVPRNIMPHSTDACGSNFC
jgi:hypothetical protein